MSADAVTTIAGAEHQSPIITPTTIITPTILIPIIITMILSLIIIIIITVIITPTSVQAQHITLQVVSSDLY